MGLDLNINVSLPLEPASLATLRLLLGLPATDAAMPSWANSFLERIQSMSGAIVDTIAALQARVQENTDVTQSAATLIQGFHGMLTAAVDAARLEGTTPAQLQPFTALIDQLDANTDRLADSIAANTAANAPQEPAQPTEGQPATGQPAEGQTGPSGSLEPAA